MNKKTTALKDLQNLTIKEPSLVNEEAQELRETQLKNLRARLQEGIDSGECIHARMVFDRLEAKYRTGSSAV